VLSTTVSGNTVFSVDYLFLNPPTFNGSSNVSAVAAWAIDSLATLGVSTTATYSGTTISGGGYITLISQQVLI